ncbi:MAG: hypothetical protein ACE5HI_00150 [bacterium]
MRNRLFLKIIHAIGLLGVTVHLPFVSFESSGLIYGLPLNFPKQQKANAQKPALDRGREILLKAVDAAGGLERFKNIDNYSIKTNNIIIQPQTKIELTVTEIAQLPDKTKQIMKLQMGERIQVLNGNRGWKQIGANVNDLSQAEKREMKRGLFRDTINIFKMSDREALRVQYFGEERLGGNINYVLHIKSQHGDFFNLYIDAQTFLVAKKSYQGASEVGLATLEEIYSDYGEVSGIKMPFQTVVKANGKKFIESKVIEANFNIEIVKDFFLRK